MSLRLALVLVTALLFAGCVGGRAPVVGEDVREIPDLFEDLERVPRGAHRPVEAEVARGAPAGSGASTGVIPGHHWDVYHDEQDKSLPGPA